MFWRVCLPSYTRESTRGAKNLLSCGFCDEFIGVGVAASQESLNLNPGVGADLVAMRAWDFFEQSVAAQQAQKASHSGRTVTAFEGIFCGRRVQRGHEIAVP